MSTTSPPLSMAMLAVLTLATATAVRAQASAPAPADHAAHHPPAAATAVPGTPATVADMAEGEVRRIDRDGAKVTLRHGEIKSLEMPPMTMVFAVQDKALLDGLKPGDRVRFRVVNESGKLTITQLSPAR